MNHFPPPCPDDRRAIDVAPIEAIAPSRRRGGTIAALAAGVLIGGLVAGTQFASASTPPVSDDPTPVDVPADEPAPDTGESVEDSDIIELGPIEVDEAEWEAWNACFDAQLGTTDEKSTGDESSTAEPIELTDEQFEAAEAACNDLLPEDVRAEMEAWGAYDACISEQLGDLGGPDVLFGDGVEDGDYHGSVSVDIPSGDDLDFSTYNFGDGDGTITITKSGTDVSVATEGDVAVFDHEAFEAEWEAHDAAWQSADEACGELMPEGGFDVEPIEIDGDFGELGDFLDGTFDVSDLEELLDGSIDLGDLKDLLEAELVD